MTTEGIVNFVVCAFCPEIASLDRTPSPASTNGSPRAMGRLYCLGGAGGIVITARKGIGVKQQTNNWRGLSRIWVIDELMGVGRIERLGESCNRQDGKERGRTEL